MDRVRIHTPKPPSAKSVSTGLVIFIALVLIFSSIRIIDQTEVGVKRVLGKVDSQELTAGLNFVPPLITKVIRIPIYEQTLEMVGEDSIKALTSEGLEVEMEVATQFAFEPDSADEIYSDLKDPYVWMRSRIRATARDVIANYKAEDLYSTQRGAVQVKLTETLSEEFEPYGINMKAVLIRDISLPPRVVERISQKIEAKQEAERMEFVIDKEMLEADRRVIEAEGIADANEIISESLSDEYLSWYWIQNLDKHDSVIYVPVSDTGVPLFREVTS